MAGGARDAAPGSRLLVRSRRWAFISDNRAGYYRHLSTEEARATRRAEEKRTVAEIWGIHAEHGGAYGVPRIHA